MTTKTDTARDQALAQVASITAMVAALECDFDRLEELRDERDTWVSGHEDVFGDPAQEWRAKHPDDAAELADLEEAAGEHEDRDSALQAIHEDPLSVEVRSDWANLGETLNPGEFRIVLCAGGPHVELQGDLQDGEPCSVRVLYRGWNDSGELFDFDHDVVLTYCQQFSFVG